MLKQLPDDKFGKQQVLLNRLVCQDACRRLLGIGASRYARLKRVAVTGAAVPLDGRCLKKPLLTKNTASVAKRSMITSFLTELYHTLSEPMPEASQSLRQSTDDPSVESVPRNMRFRRNRGRRPRAAGLWHRGKDQTELRLLPPGSFNDYLSLLRARFPEEKLSLKLFTKVTKPAIYIYIYFFFFFGFAPSKFKLSY